MRFIKEISLTIIGLVLIFLGSHNGLDLDYAPESLILGIILLFISTVLVVVKFEKTKKD